MVILLYFEKVDIYSLNNENRFRKHPLTNLERVN